MKARMIAVLALLSVLVVTGCTGLPTSGPVTAGDPVVDSESGLDVTFFPDGPQMDASPAEIVEGFLRAGSGTSDNWATARQFLAPSVQEVWDPSAGVTIVSPTGRVVEEVARDAIEISLVPLATVDADGHYEPGTGGVTTLPFRLVQIDGQWRISSAPDGIVLDESVFTAVFRSYGVMYFDPTWTYLVPDLRWFPTSTATLRITRALVNQQPGGWLTGAVRNAFPEDVSLAVASVPVTAGVAQVELSAEARGLAPETLDRMAAQLDASLATAGVAEATMSVDGAVLDATPVATRSTNVTTAPLVLTEVGFGFLSATQVTPIAGLSTAVEQAQPSVIQVGPDHLQAAVLLPDGTAARITAGGTVETVDSRPGLLAPTIDPFGFIWTIQREVPGGLATAGEELAATDLSEVWRGAGALDVDALAMSRDGTRLATVVTVGARREVWVSGVPRNDAGTPTGLGEPVLLGVVDGPVLTMTWLDDSTLGVAIQTSTGAALVEQPVGGASTRIDGPVGQEIGAVATSNSATRLQTVGGGLYVLRGANWLQSAEGIDVLATQQGSPQ